MASDVDKSAIGLLQKYAPPIVLFLILLTCWELSITLFDIPAYLVPAPSRIAIYISKNFSMLIEAFLTTFKLIVCAYLLSMVVGIPLGILIARSRLFRASVYPFLIAMQTFPKLAIGPLFVVWFGFGSTSKVLLAFLVAFFPIMINATAGVNAVRDDTLVLARSLGLGRTRTFRQIELPQALPSIFSGLRIGATLTVIGVLVAEFLGAGGGLGYLIITATGNIDTPLLFSSLVFIGLLGLLLFGTVALVEKITIGPWYRTESGISDQGH